MGGPEAEARRQSAAKSRNPSNSGGLATYGLEGPPVEVPLIRRRFVATH
jgi:hypothetical protein